MAVVSFQDQNISGQDSVFYALFSGEEIIEGPLDPEAYAKTIAPGIGGTRLGVIEADAGIDLITLDDVEVTQTPATLLSGNTIVGPLNPLATQPSEDLETTPTRQLGIYAVEDGDTVSTIAEHFDITPDTILWANGLSKNQSLKVGDQLTILPTSGVLHQVRSGDTLFALALNYEIDVDEIAKYNDIAADSILSLGQKVIVPGGTQSTPSVNTNNTQIADSSGPTPAPITSFGDGLLRPVVGYVSQGFGGRWRHSGTDIAGNQGETIYAAHSGTVIRSNYFGGYGNNVVIQSNDGKTQTLYGHNSANYVKVGQKVAKGDAIAKVGSTGRSTGYHVHFEVIRNGARINPCNVISC